MAKVVKVVLFLVFLAVLFFLAAGFAEYVLNELDSAGVI
jgi:hypothetical protein